MVGGTVIDLNAMDEVVSTVEWQIFQMSIASSAGTMWDTAVNTATNDYDAILVVAVGNYQSDGCIYSPGRAATSFNVGSHDLDDGISYFSNFGSCVDAYTSRGEYSDQVVTDAEAAAVEGEAVDFPEVDADRKGEATLRDVVAEEVLVPTVGAPLTGWRVDRFPQGPGRMRFVSTPPWSLRPPTCEPELWMIIGKAA